MSKVKKFLLLLVGVLVVSGSATYALEAEDFQPAAASWTYQNCQEVSESDDQQNTICFLKKQQTIDKINWAIQKDNNINQQVAINEQQAENDAQQAEIDTLEALTVNKDRKYTTFSISTTSAPGGTQAAEAFCADENDILLSGGHSSNYLEPIQIVGSKEGNEANGISSWRVRVAAANLANTDLRAWAHCYTVDN